MPAAQSQLISDDPATEPTPESTIAIVGDGFGSLIVYVTAIYLGFPPEQLTVFGMSENPVMTYGRLAGNLGQTVLRSESEAHFLPADWPTFAQLDAWSRRTPAPLARSIRRRYNPGLADILTEASVVGRRLGWNEARVPQRVGWVRRGWEPRPHFSLHGEGGECVARARHVMLALGRGPLALPPLLARARADPNLAGRIVHAYERKRYECDRRYVVVGAGIAAANECANALAAGAKVIALRRRATTEVQDLNVPRCLFEARGIDSFQKLPFRQRVAFLDGILKGTSPARRTWRRRIAVGRREGCYDELIGEIELIGLFLAQGWVLDALFYPRVIRWQPPWLTAVLGLGEFVIVYVLAHACGLGVSNVDAIWFYWVSWAIAVSTRIVLLPLLRLTWLEDGGEFRSIRWTVPPQRDEDDAGAALIEEPGLSLATSRSRPLGGPAPDGLG